MNSKLYPYPMLRAGGFLLAVLLWTFTGCKKKDAGSPDVVRFSFNDSLSAVCQLQERPNYDFVGGDNCEFQFGRFGKYATGEAVTIGAFEEGNCDLVTAPLPYKTDSFRVAITVNPHSWETVTYNYPSYIPNMPTGNLTLTLIQRDSNRIRGTITGSIVGYDVNTGGRWSSKLDCSYDLAIPLIKR